MCIFIIDVSQNHFQYPLLPACICHCTEELPWPSCHQLLNSGNMEFRKCYEDRTEWFQCDFEILIGKCNKV